MLLLQKHHIRMQPSAFVSHMWSAHWIVWDNASASFVLTFELNPMLVLFLISSRAQVHIAVRNHNNYLYILFWNRKMYQDEGKSVTHQLVGFSLRWHLFASWWVWHSTDPTSNYILDLTIKSILCYNVGLWHTANFLNHMQRQTANYLLPNATTVLDLKNRMQCFFL